MGMKRAIGILLGVDHDNDAAMIKMTMIMTTTMMLMMMVAMVIAVKSRLSCIVHVFILKMFLEYS
jgi:hypothetical protein